MEAQKLPSESSFKRSLRTGPSLPPSGTKRSGISWKNNSLFSQMPCPSTLWVKRRQTQDLGLDLRPEATIVALVPIQAQDLALEVTVAAALDLTPEVGVVRTQEVLLALGPILGQGAGADLQAHLEADRAPEVAVAADPDLEATATAEAEVGVGLVHRYNNNRWMKATTLKEVVGV